MSLTDSGKIEIRCSAVSILMLIFLIAPYLSATPRCRVHPKPAVVSCGHRFLRLSLVLSEPPPCFMAGRKYHCRLRMSSRSRHHSVISEGCLSLARLIKGHGAPVPAACPFRGAAQLTYLRCRYSVYVLNLFFEK